MCISNSMLLNIAGQISATSGIDVIYIVLTIFVLCPMFVFVTNCS